MEDFTILFDGLDEASAKLKEIQLIAEYKTNKYKYPDGLGYNLTDGGDGTIGTPISDEARKLVGDRFRGKKQSPEHIEKVRQKKLGVPLIAQHKENIRLSQIGVHPVGEANPLAVLNENQVREIKTALMNRKLGLITDLAKKYNVNRKTIYSIECGDSWSHVKVDGVTEKYVTVIPGYDTE